MVLILRKYMLNYGYAILKVFTHMFHVKHYIEIKSVAH